MRMYLNIFFLLFVFGCNTPQSRHKAEQSAELSTSATLFEAIANKKHNITKFPSEWDSGKLQQYTEQEIVELQFDDLKQEVDVQFFSSNEPFLTKANDSTDFFIYYKLTNGDELEKILRITRKDGFEEISLAFSGGDGQDDFSMISEFINDSTFLQIEINDLTLVDNTHSTVHSIDSVVEVFQYDSTFKFRLLHTDTFHFIREHPIYHKELKDSIFKVWSLPFEMNNLSCQWGYQVKYTSDTHENDTTIQVDLLSQKLLDFRSKKPLLQLDLDHFLFVFSPADIAILDQNDFKHTSTSGAFSYPVPYSYTNQNIDVNQNGYDDFRFLTEIGAAGANTSYATYLYDPNTHVFRYSPIFSGYNIEYDADKNRISSFTKAGYQDLHYTFTNLKPNRIDVEFVEKVRHFGDTVYYEMLIENELIEQEKLYLLNNENVFNFLKRN